VKRDPVPNVIGCIVMVVVAFFIIVACAAAIWENQPRGIESAADAAKVLRPFGEYSFLLFSAGLLTTN
jgi:Mn2+/Fe2+ NRAMP family transporter